MTCDSRDKSHERAPPRPTGLSEKYSWAVSLAFEGSGVRIEAALPPAPLTPEELAQAIAREAALAKERAWWVGCTQHSRTKASMQARTTQGY